LNGEDTFETRREVVTGGGQKTRGMIRIKLNTAIMKQGRKFLGP